MALAWQDFAARVFGNPLRPAGRIVLGLTVWAVYLADRLLDSRGSEPAPNTARHHFSRRRRRELTALLGAVLAVDTFFAAVELRRAIFVHGLVVAACVALYLLIFPARSSGWEKQGFAAALFSTGVLLIPATWLGVLPLLVPGLLFAGLCLCNLVLVEVWERGQERRLIWLAPAAIAALAMAPPRSAWGGAITISGVLLTALAVSGRRLAVDVKRGLADVALLTPLLYRMAYELSTRM